MSNIDLHILGGGPAGMTFAYYAHKKNLSIKLFESTDCTGGNCRTIEIDSFKFDTGAHRFHDKIPEVTTEIKHLMKNDLLQVSTPSKIFYNNKLINFPIQALDVIKFLNLNKITKIIIETIQNKLRKKHNYTNFKDFAYHTYGKTISELFLINYTEKLWGRSSILLSPEISGNRLKNLTLTNLVKDILYKKKSDHLDGTFYYPKYGYGTIFNKIENIINKKNINFNSSITKIIHKNYEIKKIITIKNEIFPVKKIINTLPLTTIIKILDPPPPKKIIKAIEKLSFRSLKLFIIMLDKPQISPNASIYFPSSNIPFTRIYEPKNRSSHLAPKNQTSIVIELPYEKENSNNPEDKKTMSFIQAYLIDNNFFNKKDIISTKIINIPHAYPILETGIKSKINLVVNYLKKFKNMYLLGRNANFKYMHTHEIFHKSNDLINQILNKGK